MNMIEPHSLDLELCKIRLRFRIIYAFQLSLKGTLIRFAVAYKISVSQNVRRDCVYVENNLPELHRPKWQHSTSNLNYFSYLDKMIVEMIAIFSAIILLKEEKDSELG